MTDAREAILVRLVTISEGIPDIATVTRNDFEIADPNLPAIIWLEGDEEVDLEIDRPNRPSDRPQIVHMIPQALIKAKGARSEVGPALNVIRAALIKAVMGDSELQQIAKVKNCAHYHGLATDLAYGRSMLGEMVPRFLIKYWLEPTKL